MGNNIWVLADLPLGCKPLGCKWIFKRKLKVDGTIENFKARLVIQSFIQKSGIDYFDTYAPMACISTIRLLIVMASIHNLIIHQMDVKITFLNGELDEKVDMIKEFLSSRFSMKDMGEADVILGWSVSQKSGDRHGRGPFEGGGRGNSGLRPTYTVGTLPFHEKGRSRGRGMGGRHVLVVMCPEQC
nr:zinc finger, CCHC-type [Tanacetum cinerariifolium]